MGLSVSSDRFNNLVEEAMRREPGLVNFIKIMDNVLIFTNTVARPSKEILSGV